MRPARPRRCSAASCVTRMVSRCVIPERGSNLGTRAMPESTTAVTPSIVRLVSAIDVARTILRRPGGDGAIASSCSSAAIVPCRAKTRGPFGPTRSRTRSAIRRISPAPGRNTSTSPEVSASARCTAIGTASIARVPVRGATQCVSTGKARPCAVTTGAPPRSAATRSPSSVADITTMRKSGRSSSAVRSASASPVSATTLRSWNSSKITQHTPSSVGSLASIRVSTPSVTTSMRVAGPLSVSPRTRKPTSSPTWPPLSTAIRRAAARAASRRGSSITIRCWAAQRSSSSASGTVVVLPAPGGACNTTRPRELSASRSAGRASSIGSGCRSIPETYRSGRLSSRWHSGTLALWRHPAQLE